MASARATFADLVKVYTYAVNCMPSDREILADVRKEFLGDEDLPVLTLVGVRAVALPEFLVETRAIAVAG